MGDIEQLPHELDEAKRECRAIIETPKGRRNKFKYKPELALFSLSSILPKGFVFPFDFGFIPSTAGDDGDALDVVVLMDEPAHVGCELTVRIIGVIRVEQTERGKTVNNDRLVAVATQSYEYVHVESLKNLNKPVLDQMTEFLGLYNKNKEKQDKIKGVEGPEAALDTLRRAIKAFEAK